MKIVFDIPEQHSILDHPWPSEFDATAAYMLIPVVHKEGNLVPHLVYGIDSNLPLTKAQEEAIYGFSTYFTRTFSDLRAYFDKANAGVAA